ncbi:MAG: flagellar filament capping protein FliD [Planctomycetota bacterium]
MLSIDGLVSGFDTTTIIQDILSLERRPIQLIAQQQEEIRARQGAYLGLSAQLLNLQNASRRLASPDTFSGVSVTSTNEDVLVASGGSTVPPGSYSFQVAQLARGSQFLSGGFATSDDTPVGAGQLTLEVGGGFVDTKTELENLNGGSGVSRGTFRLTDASGSTAIIDVSTAVTLDDVIQEINDTVGVDITASIAGSANTNTGRGLVLEDSSGGGGTLLVEEVGSGNSAGDLGILGSGVGTTLEGGAIYTIGSDTRLSSLADGLGARSGAGDDILFTLSDATTIDIDLDGVNTVGDLIDAVNNDAANVGNLTMSINAEGDGFDIVDTAGGPGNLTIADFDPLLGSAATDLGIAGTSAGGTINGTRVLAGLNDTLLSTLNGGSGVTAGSITVKDRAAGVGVAVDLTTAETLQDVIRAINDSAADVVASVNPEGNGILIRDTSGGSGDLEISEAGSTTAAELGILSGPVSDNEFNGSDLDPRYMHANTLLAGLNGGRGVAAGQIRITGADGVSFTVNLDGTNMGDVIRDIEGAASIAGSNLTVGFNAAGNGLLLGSAGGGTMRVEDVSGGRTAQDLHIAGTSTTNQIDGAFAETITIGAEDTLQDVKEAIEALGIGVSASVLNDGSSSAPYRLNIVAGTAGLRGRLMVDTSGGTDLGFQQTASAQDGVIFYGESGAGSEPILIRSNSNTYTDIVGGLTVTAQTVSDSAVRVNVSRDHTRIKEDIGLMVESFNEILADISSLTSFNSDTEEAGILLGDSVVRNLKNSVIRGLNRPLTLGDNDFTLASQVGLRIQNNRVIFDSNDFDAAIEENPDAVRTLFSAFRSLEASTELDDFNNGNGVDTSASGDDFEILLRDGSTVNVDIGTASTLQEVIDAINAAGAGNVTAAISASQQSIELTDATTGSDTFRVKALNESSAFNDLGLNKTADVSGGGTLTGFDIDLTDDVGIAARLTDAIERLIDVDTGVLQSRSDSFDQVILDLDDRIERAEERIARREETLRRQFAQLEQVMQSSQNTLQRLNASLSGLG